jgi:signal transduction histidine kinase
MRAPGRGKLMLMRAVPGSVDASTDLRTAGPAAHIEQAFVTLFGPGDRLLRVAGTAPKNPEAMVEVVIDEKPLCDAMLAFAERILALSLAISLITAALVYFALHLLLVRPMRRVTESMTRFRDDPEDPASRIRPSNRTDEIGVAEAELASMQEALAAALHQKTRLAALGIAVTKINHDLKNILSSARLVSDRLAENEDPKVSRSANTLMKTIDRAVHLCQQTLNFTQEGPPKLAVTRFDLSGLVDEVAAELAPDAGTPAEADREDTAAAGPLVNRLPAGLEVEADRDQLYRVFANLCRNAVEAGAAQVHVSAKAASGALELEIADDGPGLPPRARENLFQPFAGTAKAGGTGLGLAIARDLVRAHGGELSLSDSTSEGTRFRLRLPRRAARAAPGPAEEAAARDDADLRKAG